MAAERDTFRAGRGASSRRLNVRRKAGGPVGRRSPVHGRRSKVRPAGLTTEKWRRSRVAISAIPRRSPATTTEASTVPSGRSRYLPTRSAMRSQSAGATGSGMRFPAARVAEESHLGVDADAGAEQVDDLGDDELRDDQRSDVGLEEVEAGGVVGIVAVDVGVQRTGVDDQRDPGTSAARMSSMRSEMSVWPLAPAPAARSERRPPLPLPPRWASIASRVRADTVVPRRSAS